MTPLLAAAAFVVAAGASELSLPTLPAARPYETLLQASKELGAALETRFGEAAADDAARRLERWLGLLAEVRGFTHVDGATLRSRVSAGLAAGRYQGLILGETHSVPGERAFARALLEDALAAGARPGAFLRESFTFDDAGFLEARGIPVLTFRNQFQPDPEIAAALKRHPGKLFAYAGHAHTAERVKDYIQNVLESGRPFGYGPGLKDMPTIERAFKDRGLKPAIVAMLGEEGMLARVQWLCLQQALSGKPDAAQFRTRLEEAVAAWNRRMARLPSSLAASWPGLKFYSHPKQDNLVIGVTLGDRRPGTLQAALTVLREPDVESWLSGRRVAALESLRQSMGAPDGSLRVTYTVVLRRDDGERLVREIGLP